MSSNDSHTTLSNSTRPYALTLDEQELLGYSCMALILVCSMAYVPVLFIFKRRTHFNQHLSYRIMLHIGLMEVFYLWSYVFVCLMIVMDTSFGPTFGRGFLAIRSSVFWAMNVLTTILALNRSEVICGFPRFLNKNDWFFKPSNKLDDPTFFKILLCLAYISSFVICILYCIPGFQGEVRGLTNIRDEYNKEYLYPIILFTSFGLFIFSYILYVTAGIKLILLRCKSSSNNNIFSKQELSLFIQSFIICGYKSGMILMWTYCAPTTKEIYFIYWISTIFENGYNPFMYYLMNRTLRREINSLLTCKNTLTSIQVL